MCPNTFAPVFIRTHLCSSVPPWLDYIVRSSMPAFILVRPMRYIAATRLIP